MQMRQGNFDYATELLAGCFLGDPTNLLYIQTLLGNLKQKFNNNKKGDRFSLIKGVGARGMCKKAAMQKDWKGVLKHGIDVLRLNPWDISTLTSMAHACEELEYYDAQLMLLRTALEPNSKDPDVNKACALALEGQRRFVEAIDCWHRVQLSRPNNEEAEKAISRLAVEQTIKKGQYEEQDKVKATAEGEEGEDADLSERQKLERDLRLDPRNVKKYLELADLHMNANRFDKAEEVFAQALEVSNGAEEIRDAWEDAQLRHLRTQLHEAEARAEKTHKEEDIHKVENFKQQWNTKDMEFWKRRAERFPGNLNYKYELGVRYQVCGMYQEAIHSLQDAQKDTRRRGLCMLALGHCFREIQQLRMAASHYETAINELPGNDLINRKQALYSAGKLAVVMKKFDLAEKHLSALAGLDFAYKDVSQLLDKLSKFREQRRQRGEEEEEEEEVRRNDDEDE